MVVITYSLNPVTLILTDIGRFLELQTSIYIVRPGQPVVVVLTFNPITQGA